MLHLIRPLGQMLRPSRPQLTAVAPAFATALLTAPHHVRFKHQYEPKRLERDKKFKGRVPVRTGGSIKGSTLAFGKYGLRLVSEGLRLKAIQLKEADNAIMRDLRPLQGILHRRLVTHVAVCIKGNESRMGKGKGPFEYWCARVPTGKIIFEIDGNVPEQIARKTLSVAKDKLPGRYEFVTRDSLPKAGYKQVDLPTKNVPANYFQKAAAAPTKKFANIIASKDEDIRKYLRR